MKLTHRAIVSLMLGSSMSLCLSCVACQAGPTPEQKSARPNAGANAGISWTQYEDPNEHAFTIDVPRGWTVKGGMFRFGYSDARPEIVMRSPDGKMEIQLGDERVPVYVVPDRLHPQEGQPYDLGAQGQTFLAKYHRGPEYAALYSQTRFHGECRNPQPDASAPEFVAPDSAPDDAGVRESSAGQITYRCDSDGGPRVAFAYVKTASYGAIWAVPGIGSYFVAPDEVSTARDILRHCAQSVHFSPEWLQYKARLDAQGLEYQRARQQQRRQDLAQQQQEFIGKMNSMKNMANDFEQRMDQERGQFAKMSDVINGVTQTTDPMTGESRKVWTGTQNNYWANGLGQVVNSNLNPDPSGNWHQLQVGPQ